MNMLPDEQVSEKETIFSRFKKGILNSVVGRLFLDRKFFYYTCIGIFFAVFNVFLLWLLIDILHISTVIASSFVIGLTFILRYVFFHFFKVF